MTPTRLWSLFITQCYRADSNNYFRITYPNSLSTHLIIL